MTKGCLSKSTIIHEFIHAIGFDHEQNRPDGDDYVKINWDNIKSGRKSQFDIAKGSKTFGTPYDGFSVMHYTAYHFTKYFTNYRINSMYHKGRVPFFLKKLFKILLSYKPKIKVCKVFGSGKT